VFAFTLPTHDAMEQAYQRLLQLGMLVPYIHYPDSLGGYFRLAVSAAHTEPDFALLERGLREVLA
jgi:7-keto-8-aminopelargonate synthetase-like enzyme